MKPNVRELLGWVLLGCGLAAFALTFFVFLLQRRLLESIPMTFIGFIVTRVGLQLIKVGVAARVATESTNASAPRAAARPVLLGGRPTDEKQTVIPGKKGSAPAKPAVTLAK